VAPRPSGLGRGLAALIPAELSTERADRGTPTFAQLPIGDIVANPNQPRRDFDEEGLAALTSSIREIGVLQPILVRPLDDGRFQLVAGERRWRAARRAGLATVPALVRVLDDIASLEQAVVENLHRQDLNPLEEAAAYQQLIEEFKLTHEHVAVRVGKSRAAVSNALRLFQLPPTVQKIVAERQLSAGQAKALLATPDRAFLEHLARRAVAEGLTVRDIENVVRTRADLDAPSTLPPPGARSRSAVGTRALGEVDEPGLLELQEVLASHLDTRVTITATAGRGRITIEFADLEDLERIYRRMAEAGGDTVDTVAEASRY
jgi:ParB family transcriptional regulator, chromosome partitioning protein